MSNWIDINLPWYNDDILDYYPVVEDPNLDKRIRKIFGKTLEEKEQELFPGYHNKYELISEHPYFIKYKEIRDKISEKYEYLSEEDRKNLVNEELKKSNSKEVQAVLERQNYFDKIDIWYSQQPEVIEADEKRQKLFLEYENKKKITCFRESDYCKPGVLIEVKSNDVISKMIIGDINASGGVCDDCRGIQNEDIILRCKILYDSSSEI